MRATNMPFCKTMMPTMLALVLTSSCDPAPEPPLVTAVLEAGGPADAPSKLDGGTSDSQDADIAMVTPTGMTDARVQANDDDADDDAGTATNPAPRTGERCVLGGGCLELAPHKVDKVDLLFMVDNSNSMAGEQASLKAQFPKLIAALTRGERFPGDPQPFAPLQDLHVGVVSSDLGTPGFDLATSCRADGGDNARLQNTPRGAGCNDAGSYPTFLSFQDAAHASAQAAEQFANDVSCIAELGTGGCGHEQQLEAPFKALWPAQYRDPESGDIVANPYTFLIGTGLGDNLNAGFLRNESDTGPSLLAVVVVTDEEDCSVSNTDHLKPNTLLMSGDPLIREDMNLRCFLHPDKLQPLKERYYDGLRKLRPGREDLVVFSAIVGVPAALVAKAELPDFADTVAREQFYERVLSDPAMQQVIDPTTNPGTGTGNLTPSCRRPLTAPPPLDVTTAYPPRRMVELAREFGPNGLVQSLCQDDFSDVMAANVELIANHLGGACLTAALARDAAGHVDCEVVWEWPAAAAPVACDDQPFLSEPAAPRGNVSAAGGSMCVVHQLPVDSSHGVPTGSGWYYDDFSDQSQASCPSDAKRSIAFTADATPPAGVRALLDCQPNAFDD